MKILNKSQLMSHEGGLTKVQCDTAGGFLAGLSLGLAVSGIGAGIGLVTAGAGLVVTLACM